MTRLREAELPVDFEQPLFLFQLAGWDYFDGEDFLKY